MTLPARFWMPENPKGKPYVTTGPLAAPPYVECVRVDSLDGWRDISSAPKDGIPILAYGYSKHYPDEYFTRIQWWSEGINDWGAHSVSIIPTHWMPLPAPPT